VTSAGAPLRLSPCRCPPCPPSTAKDGLRPAPSHPTPTTSLDAATKGKPGWHPRFPLDAFPPPTTARLRRYSPCLRCGGARRQHPPAGHAEHLRYAAQNGLRLRHRRRFGTASTRHTAFSAPSFHYTVRRRTVRPECARAHAHTHRKAGLGLRHRSRSHAPPDATRLFVFKILSQLLVFNRQMKPFSRSRYHEY